MPEHNDVQPSAQVLANWRRLQLSPAFFWPLILTVASILWSLLQNNQRTIVML
jgi:hypothetical protein